MIRRKKSKNNIRTPTNSTPSNSLDSASDESVIMCGELKKKGKVNTSWKNRWCELLFLKQGLTLAYYSNKHDKHLCGTIKTTDIFALKVINFATKDYNLPKNVTEYENPKNISDLKYSFALCTLSREYILSAPNKTSFNNWIETFNKYIYGNIIKKGSLLLKKKKTNNTWKQRYFILNQYKQFKFYKNRNKQSFCGAISLSQIGEITNGKIYDNTHKFTLNLHCKSNKRKWVLCCKTNNERNKWKHTLKNIQSNSSIRAIGQNGMNTDDDMLTDMEEILESELDAVWNSYITHSSGKYPSNAFALIIYSRRDNKLQTLTPDEAQHLIDKHKNDYINEEIEKKKQIRKEMELDLEYGSDSSEYDEDSENKFEEFDKQNSLNIPHPLSPQFKYKSRSSESNLQLPKPPPRSRSMSKNIGKHKHKKRTTGRSQSNFERSKSVSRKKHNKRRSLKQKYKNGKTHKLSSSNGLPRPPARSKSRPNSICSPKGVNENSNQITQSHVLKYKTRPKSACFSDENGMNMELKPTQFKFNANNLQRITVIESDSVELDDIVSLTQYREGVIKYIGNVHFDNGLWYGIELTNGINGIIGLHDGTVDGIAYFKSPPYRGLFVQGCDIRRKIGHMDPMSPTMHRRISTQQIRKKRKRKIKHVDNAYDR